MVIGVGTSGQGGNVGLHNSRELGDKDHAKSPRGGLASSAESDTTPVEVWAVAEPCSSPKQTKNEGLRGDAEARAAR